MPSTNVCAIFDAVGDHTVKLEQNCQPVKLEVSRILDCGFQDDMCRPAQKGCTNCPGHLASVFQACEPVDNCSTVGCSFKRVLPLQKKFLLQYNQKWVHKSQNECMMVARRLSAQNGCSPDKGSPVAHRPLSCLLASPVWEERKSKRLLSLLSRSPAGLVKPKLDKASELQRSLQAKAETEW